jgi:hypothetical protein
MATTNETKRETKRKGPAPTGLARPYRVLNVDAGKPAGAPGCVPATPLAMVNGRGRWCLSATEARDLAIYCRAHGYRVEIVRATEAQ